MQSPLPPLSSRAQPRDPRLPSKGPATRRACNRPLPPLSSRAQPRDLRLPSSRTTGTRMQSPLPPFFIPSAAEGSAVALLQQQTRMQSPLPPLSSRAQPRDLRLHSSSNRRACNRLYPLCHPERSRGICGCAPPATDAHPNRLSPLCHPERSRGICGFYRLPSG